MKARPGKYLYSFLLVIAVLAALKSYTGRGIAYSMLIGDVDSVVGFLSSAGVYSSALFILLVVAEVLLAPIPPLILYSVGGIVFGTFWGGTLALIGNVIGAALAYLIARNLGHDFVEKSLDRKTRKRFHNFTEKYGALSIFLLRVNPLTSADIFSYMAGISGMRLKSFLLGTTLGLAPLVYLQAYFGDLISRSPLLSSLFFILGLLYVVLFSYYFILKKK